LKIEASNNQMTNGADKHINQPETSIVGTVLIALQVVLGNLAELRKVQVVKSFAYVCLHSMAFRNSRNVFKLMLLLLT